MGFQDKFTGPVFTEPFDREAWIERQLAKAPPISEETRRRLVRLLTVEEQ